MNYITLGYENLLTIFLAILGTIIVLLAQIKIKVSYAKNKIIQNKKI